MGTIMAGNRLRSWTILRWQVWYLCTVRWLTNFITGYLNGVSVPAGNLSLQKIDMFKVIGSVSTILRLLYGERYTGSDAQSQIASIAFAGTVVGHLGFGYLSDHWSRRNSLLISTISTSTSVYSFRNIR
jgi:MFS family permease